jgi:pyruvate dehydrogenase E1 component alpha subunit
MPRLTIPLAPVERLAILDAEGRADPRLEPAISAEVLRRLHRVFLVARALDERMLRLQRQGRIGTYLPIRGHEAVALGAASALRPADWLVPVWREWPAYLWRGWPLEQLVLLHAGYTEGTRVPDGLRDLPVCIPIASQVPHAAGLAWACRHRREDAVTLCFLGDGATSHADAQEAMNFAGVFGLPLVFVCVNNQWAISLPRSRQTRAPTLAHRALAYGFPGLQVDGNDLLAVHVAVREAVERARRGEGPTLVEAVTYRLLAHSTADDPTRYRDEAEVRTWESREPLPRFRRYLEARGVVDEATHAEMATEAEAAVREAVERAEARMAEPPPPLDLFDHVHAELPAELVAQREEAARALAPGGRAGDQDAAHRSP